MEGCEITETEMKEIMRMNGMHMTVNEVLFEMMKMNGKNLTVNERQRRNDENKWDAYIMTVNERHG